MKSKYELKLISLPAGTLRTSSFNIYIFYVVIALPLCVLRTNNQLCLIQP